MGNFVERSPLFKTFCVLVFLAHCIQLAWNQPLIARQSPVAPIPFNPDILDHNSESDSLPGSSPPASASSSLSSSDSTSSSNSEGVTSGQERPHPRPLEDAPPSPSTSNSLCSIFRTFLDSRSVQCRVSRLNSEDVDSNALIQIRSPSSNSLRAVTPPETPTDSRIDHFDHIEQDEENEGLVKVLTDDTKILQDKTTIIVPNRPCPAGQRRDPRGYCRTVLHIRTYNGQQIHVRPVRYYYQRFVAIPTLHFILP